MAEEQWYYLIDGTQAGPVSTLELRDLISTEQVARGELVWKYGLPEWAPASDFPYLLAPVEPVPVAPPTPRSSVPVSEAPLAYAPFWKRAAALAMDAILVATVATVLLSFRDDPAILDPSDLALARIMLLVWWIYGAAFESSAWQATPGKRAFRMRVTDLDGERISFLRATGRHFAKNLSALPLFGGYFLAAFTQKRQTLHDMIAECFVVEGQPSNGEVRDEA